MSKADEIFIGMCRDIIDNGSTTEGKYVRGVWDDGEKAYTKKVFGVCNRYDLREEFPAITIRPTAIKSATEEMLWIYSQKSNNTELLNTGIWDKWADKNHRIGKAYGYQIAKHNVVLAQGDRNSMYDLMNKIHNNPCKTPAITSLLKDKYQIKVDQMDMVLYQLKHDPFSRRIMTNMYNHSELHEMALHPCAYSCTFNVTDEGDDKLVLNLLLNQRSQDVLVANNWNVVQYAVLLKMLAQVSDMIPGELIHMIGDTHIYDRHIPIIEDLITREPYDAPTVTLDPDITNFYDFTKKSVIVENYKTHPQVENIEVTK